MASKIIDRDLGWARITRELAKDFGLVVDVGFIDDPENATKATFNEFGTSDAPARPFMRNAFDANTKAYETTFRDGMRAVSDGKKTPEQVAEALGEMAVADIKASITGFSTPPLDPETKREKGHGKPLVDTGAMRDAITFRVRKVR